MVRAGDDSPQISHSRTRMVLYSTRLYPSRVPLRRRAWTQLLSRSSRLDLRSIGLLGLGQMAHSGGCCRSPPRSRKSMDSKSGQIVVSIFQEPPDRNKSRLTHCGAMGTLTMFGCLIYSGSARSTVSLRRYRRQPKKCVTMDTISLLRLATVAVEVIVAAQHTASRPPSRSISATPNARMTRPNG